MGRGRSKSGAGGAGGGGTASYNRVNVDTSNGASFKTVEMVEKMVAGKENDSRTEVRQALEQISPGQKVTVYNGEYTGGRWEQNIINDPVVYTKLDDGTWRGDDGRRYENSDISRRYYNGGAGKLIQPGEVSTESHVRVESGGAQTIDGVKWNKGTFDIQARDGMKPVRKVEQTGRITTYNGTQYATARTGGAYTVTHVDTGLRLGEAKSMKAATELVKNMDSRVKSLAGIEETKKRFQKMARGD